MKVKIGKYPEWIGPYQIAEKILFWIPKYDENLNTNDTVHKFGTWLSGGEDGSSLLNKLCNWIHSKQKRTIKVHIDRYDVWNAHNTASLILHPLLKKLKESKNGSGYVDDEDVPEAIRSTASDAWTGISEDEKVNMGYSDNHMHARYEWMLDEVIWALEQDNNDWEEQFYSGDHDIKFVPDMTRLDENGQPLFSTMEKGPKDTFKADYDGMKVYQARISNGFRLMGKYYQTFWD